MSLEVYFPNYSWQHLTLSIGLLGLKDCALGADPLGAASLCQSKLALGAETMFAVVAKKTLES